jgi:hypothetical protein
MSDLISVIEASRQLGRKKQTLFKAIRRLGIHVQKQRMSDNGNQFVAFLTTDDFQRLANELRPTGSGDDPEDDGFISAEVGVFYLIRLEPQHDPLRFKVGFASNMAERLRALRCSAPFAEAIKTWPCKRLWEKTAIDCVTVGSERLHTEVFRAASFEDVVSRCDHFFSQMPVVSPAK